MSFASAVANITSYGTRTLALAFAMVALVLGLTSAQNGGKTMMGQREREQQEISRLGTDELSDILRTLQVRISKTPYLDESRTLRGSYGVHLYYLRQRDHTAALGFTQWMVEYVKNHPISPTRR